MGRQLGIGSLVLIMSLVAPCAQRITDEELLSLSGGWRPGWDYDCEHTRRSPSCPSQGFVCEDDYCRPGTDCIGFKPAEGKSCVPHWGFEDLDCMENIENCPDLYYGFVSNDRCHCIESGYNPDAHYPPIPTYQTCYDP